MRVLVACEYSGAVRDEFAALGHDAWSCDLMPSEKPTLFHIRGDVREVLREGWDLVIAHPTCTRLTNSGVRWLAERNLWGELDDAAEFFRVFFGCAPKVAIENPIPHGHALERIGRKYDQIIHPWMFGHGETKATCLWLEGLPKLQPTNVVAGREPRIHRMSPGPDRAKERSRTYAGIAKAMAQQWGVMELETA